MPYKESIAPCIIGMALICTSITVSASKFDMSSVEDQPIIVAQSVQHQGHENCNNQNSEKKACQNKKGMHKNRGGMMGHMSARSGHGGHSYAHMITTHADELKLSDAQLGRIVRLHMKHAQEHKQFKKTIRKSMMHFHHASMKPSTDDATLRKLGNEHVESFKAMLEQHIRSRNVVHAILTAEQREQLKTMKMKHGRHGGGHSNYRNNHGKHGSKHSQRYY